MRDRKSDQVETIAANPTPSALPVGAERPTGQNTGQKTGLRAGMKPHLTELDRLRIITALSVIAVHTLGNTLFFDHTLLAREIQDGVVTALHFTREIFMFITALALVYVYYGKPFATGRFLKKRAIGVLIPYALWTLLYVLVNNRFTSFWAFSRTLLIDLLNGSASYQLYYILLTLEFYLIFPWFLRLLPALARRPWLTLSISFALELVVVYADQSLLPVLPLSAGVRGFVGPLFDRFVPVYQLYFVLGALVAVYLSQIQAFISRHGVWVALVGVASLVALEAHYIFDVNVAHVSLGDATVVLQPIMVVYSLGCIAFLYWMTRAQALRVARLGRDRVRRAWHDVSDAAFGLYLVHPLILGIVMVFTAPLMTRWPTLPLEALLWLLTAGCSLGLTLLLLRTPVLSRVVGREYPLPRWLTRLGGAWALQGEALWRSAQSAVQPVGRNAPREQRERNRR